SDAHHNIVRLGIGLFGLSDTNRKLHNVLSFKTNISQIKSLEPNSSVGYGRGYVSSKSEQIATLPVGYADGLFRALGNQKFSVSVKGKPAKIVGRVCMDMCMIDISGIDCQEGDEVIIFDSLETIREMANLVQTIPYEIISRIADRVKRVYIED
ncbi:MAG: bifunctional UDP-N-acetylmuramoyl-tripeptide:D-alanyl-D-alanine ligase/alanine racemase, partial [Bacteroidetes bacterium]|nr:bifunctional UDP-N-acetylmuramoyl-tripeptide:D-alanyl-D-alanine ligase/alanine racemase [Bacteroidota bacterium]